MHCDIAVSSKWRKNPDGKWVCCGRGCWREECWLPALQRRGRKRGGGDDDDEQFAEGLPPAGTLREIVKVEGQRCALHPTPSPSLLHSNTH